MQSNGEAEVITILLRQVGTIKKLKFDIDFSNLAIKEKKFQREFGNEIPN
jgi:hypothetical protein